jgi:bifunctional non-homologous end joining protein LigD
MASRISRCCRTNCAANPTSLYVFDLLYLNGFDLQKAPHFERKAWLRKLTAKTDILFSESFETDGEAMFKQACKMGLEGVVSKIPRQPVQFRPRQ